MNPNLLSLFFKVFENKETMLEEAIKLAALIASKSPVAVQATKRNIIYSMDKPNQEGLDHIVSFLKILPNASISSILKFLKLQKEINKLNLQSQDFFDAIMAQQTKEAPVFSKL